MRHVATSWTLIEQILKEHAHSVYRSLRPPASERRMTLLNGVLPAPVPHAFEQSIRLHDGMLVQLRRKAQECRGRVVGGLVRRLGRGIERETLYSGQVGRDLSSGATVSMTFDKAMGHAAGLAAERRQTQGR